MRHILEKITISFDTIHSKTFEARFANQKKANTAAHKRECQ